MFAASQAVLAARLVVAELGVGDLAVDRATS
jgi:hypothetical protein